MKAIFKREFINYFNTKTTLVFAICFVFFANFLALNYAELLATNNADLTVFFSFHPWLYCLLLPAVSSPIFIEESKKGSIEILFSLPINSFNICLGKFLAVWAFVGCCLLATSTIWITLNIFASPSNILILFGYIASFLLAGCMLVIGMVVSSTTQSTTISFIVTTTIGFFLIIIGYISNISFVQEFLPVPIINLIYTFNFSTAYNNMLEGIINIKNIIWFFSFISLGLILNTVLLERKKS